MQKRHFRLWKVTESLDINDKPPVSRKQRRTDALDSQKFFENILKLHVQPIFIVGVGVVCFLIPFVRRMLKYLWMQPWDRK